MKSVVIFALWLISVTAVAEQAAGDRGSKHDKRLSLGILSFATAVVYASHYPVEDDEFSGLGLYGTLALNNAAALRLTLAEQDHEKYDNLELSTTEISLLLGGGLRNSGLKLYSSFGYFSEDLSASGRSGEYRFSGFMVGAGLGYSWDVVTMDLWFNVRDSEDYDDFVGPYVDAAAASAGLGVAIRL